MSEFSDDSEHASDDSSHKQPTSNNGRTNVPAEYAKQQVTQDLHPAFVDTDLCYDASSDSFVAEVDDVRYEAALFDSQRAFADALQKFQQDVEPKYKSEIDLGATHDWDEVMTHVKKAREQYTGVGKEGIIKKIDKHLKGFQTAAPAIQAWLKLLPSTSVYGSVVCGGLTIILEAAVRLRQLRKEVVEALDQMPICIENAQILMRTHGYTHLDQQMVNLYSAIIEALHHILAWYERAAGMKYVSSFSKGPAYAQVMKKKMENVDKASQAMKNRAEQLQHLQMDFIRKIAVHTKDQVEDVKILALEARNHLYEIFKDTEVWRRETLEAWKQSERHPAVLREDQNLAARKSLLSHFQSDHVDQTGEVATVLAQITSMTLDDQDRVIAIIEHQAVINWMLDKRFAALLVHGNGRRHDSIAPTSVACALIIHVFLKKLRCPTLYWFCGLHDSGSRGNPIGMLRSLICQLLSLSCCVCSTDDQIGLDTGDFVELMKLFVKLLQRSSSGNPIVCLLDGISFYEARHQRDDSIRLVDELARLARSEPSLLLLLLTSPMRTNYLVQRPNKALDLVVAEIPMHVNGARQGFNGRQAMSSIELIAKARSGSSAKHMTH
ncbi:MAG: hypothetical protein Q9169_006596 [Polycauliona sp. 2 TL-2023]